MQRESQRRFPSLARSRLFYRYAALLITVVALSVILTGSLHTWFSYHELNALLQRAQGEQAKSAAGKIGQFVKEIEGQLAWATQLPPYVKTEDDWRFDAMRLFRQAPSVTEIAQLDASGRERFRSSRQAMDVIGSMADFSRDPAFIEASARKAYYGPVYFVRESEPYMTIAVAGARPEHGVIVAQVNLKFIWDVVSQIKVGQGGRIYVADSEGRLIAHPDISLVLRKTDLSWLSHVQSAHASAPEGSSESSSLATDLNGQEVLIAYAPIEPLGWFVFAEMPVREAFAPLYDGLIRSGLLLAAGLFLAVLGGLFFAHRMVGPIRTLIDGSRRLGSGDLSQRIAITTGNELDELGNQFNRMAMQLQDSYSTLERKVEERTRQLELATEAKSRFLATASHDLRQPLHALGLFVAQLRGTRADERKKIVEQIELALSAMNELFNALLDVTKLDAGVLTPALTEFPAAQLLERIRTTFTGSAREKGLSLRIIDTDAWVRSDFILLERIVSNFVSNAIRYTSEGRVVVGCRKRAGQLRIEVWDTGPGVPEDQKQNIFGEFYRLKSSNAHEPGGLGLGLAIVDRLSQLLNHPINVMSTSGKGACFSVTVPVVTASARSIERTVAPRPRLALSDGKLVVVIDNDPLVLEGMSGLIRSWGCQVVTGETGSAIIRRLAGYAKRPDLIISDYHLCEGHTGIDAINQLRRALDASIPAFLMSGDVNPEPLRAARAQGYPLLHKPVEPMALRATLSQMVKQRAASTT